MKKIFWETHLGLVVVAIVSVLLFLVIEGYTLELINHQSDVIVMIGFVLSLGMVILMAIVAKKIVNQFSKIKSNLKSQKETV